MKFLATAKQRYPAAYALARSFYLWTGRVVLSIFSSSRISIAFYYFCLDRSFWREHYAATKGVVRYRTQNSPSTHLFLLRRNIHRLEKGLSMQPRRPCFGMDYIQETVNVFNSYRQSSTTSDCDTIVKWARDVLEKYFELVAPNSIVEQAEKNFSDPSSSSRPTGRVPVRYKERMGQSHGVTVNSLRLLSQSRRSVRWFKDQPVPRATIDMALEIAAKAPSSCNRQPFEYRIFDNGEMVGQLARMPRGTKGFAENIPCLVAVVGDLSSYSSICDRHGIYIDAGLSVMGFLYALETLDIASCILNWPDIESLERRMQKLLDLEDHERVVMLIALGFADPEGMVPYSEKTSIENIRHYHLDDRA